MKEKKGFTLIELLAVIVILAIIAVIATPLILGVIETARKGSMEASALGYVDAVEKQIAINQLDSTKSLLNDGVYKDFNELKEKYGVEVKGDAPTEGWIQIKNGQVVDYALKIGSYVVDYDVETKDSTVENNVEVSKYYVCKRAEELHEEMCSQNYESSFCSGAGYEENSTILYGNKDIEIGKLNSGDAFDCDVNGDGIYDAETERFYYVSGLNGEDNSDIAVLIYYKNTTLGIADNTQASLMAYYGIARENWHGPTTAKNNLPTIAQWSNISLTNSTRTITNENGGTTTTNGSEDKEIVQFSYEGYAARLLTYQELVKGCGGGSLTSKGDLNKCEYLMENTKYSSNENGTYGFLLETPYSGATVNSWRVDVNGRSIGNEYVDLARFYGVRPVIEVFNEDILYK